jgi:hypothetical protein
LLAVIVVLIAIAVSLVIWHPRRGPIPYGDPMPRCTEEAGRVTCVVP